MREKSISPKQEFKKEFVFENTLLLFKKQLNSFALLPQRKYIPFQDSSYLQRGREGEVMRREERWMGEASIFNIMFL